jgi:hypothetical protein
MDSPREVGRLRSVSVNPSASASLRAIPSRTSSSWPLMAALTVSTLAFAVALTWSWHYYGLSLDSRFDAPLHRQLRPSGSFGHLYGNIGIALILGNLLYLVRRRLVSVAWLGSMRAWMD